MKRALLFSFLLSSILSFAQCVDCNSLEEALKEPEKVKTLKINPWQHEITLQSLPDDIGKLVNVEIMYLSDHEIKEIPKTISNLTQLKELSFAGCQLNAIPDEIFSLKNLKELILLNNDFSDEYKDELKARFKKELPKTMVLIN